MDGTAQGQRRLAFSWITLTALSVAACASSQGPVARAKLTQAERAFDEAQQASAAINAPTELKAAEDRLKDAKEAVAKKSYERAIRAAEQASVEADYARARAANHRINQLVDEMRQSIRVLRQEIERLPE